MMQFTITRDSDNAITKTVSAGALSLAESQVLTGHTLHSGHYPPDKYDYDGTDFTLKAEQPVQPFIFQPTRAMLAQMYNEMSLQGFDIPAHVDGIQSKAHARMLIDQAAGRARRRFVSPGLAVNDEYRQVLTQATQFLSDITQTTPPMIASWALASDRTDIAAAQNIIETSVLWESVLNATYHLRLNGKSAVDDASDADYKSVAQSYIEQLEAI